MSSGESRTCNMTQIKAYWTNTDLSPTPLEFLKEMAFQKWICLIFTPLSSSDVLLRKLRETRENGYVSLH